MPLFATWKKCRELKKQIKELENDNKKYRDFYSRFYYGDPLIMREAIRRSISHNSSNIRNFNYKDRKYHTRKYVCLDGQKVRSKVEREIYNYLLLNGVKVRYESIYRTPWGSVIRPDFYLPEHQIYIEYFGKEEGEDEKYDAIVHFKKDLYSFSLTPFVILTPDDEKDLYSAIKSKLSPYIDVSLWF